MFRCFNEQLYTLKGTHTHLAKKKFNRLIQTAKKYEDEILKTSNGNKDIDVVYDHLMDLIIEMKTKIFKDVELL